MTIEITIGTGTSDGELLRLENDLRARAQPGRSLSPVETETRTLWEIQRRLRSNRRRGRRVSRLDLEEVEGITMHGLVASNRARAKALLLEFDWPN